MEIECLKNFSLLSIDNFNFKPSNFKNNNSSSKKLLILDDLNFPGKEKLSNLFFYESLSLLLKMKKSLKDKNQKIIENILSITYSFYSGNKNIINTLDIWNYVIPYKNSEKIKKWFCENDDYISFLVFNWFLLLYKQIRQIFVKIIIIIF